MAAHIQYLILYVSATLSVESEDLVLKALPLCLFVTGIVFGIRLVGAVDKTKVLRSLRAWIRSRRADGNREERYIVETVGLSVWIILQEVSGDGRILYMRRCIVPSAHHSHQSQDG